MNHEDIRQSCHGVVHIAGDALAIRRPRNVTRSTLPIWQKRHQVTYRFIHPSLRFIPQRAHCEFRPVRRETEIPDERIGSLRNQFDIPFSIDPGEATARPVALSRNEDERSRRRHKRVRIIRPRSGGYPMQNRHVRTSYSKVNGIENGGIERGHTLKDQMPGLQNERVGGIWNHGRGAAGIQRNSNDVVSFDRSAVPPSYKYASRTWHGRR